MGAGWLSRGERGGSRVAVAQALGDGVSGEVSHSAGTWAQVVFLWGVGLDLGSIAHGHAELPEWIAYLQWPTFGQFGKQGQVILCLEYDMIRF